MVQMVLARGGCALLICAHRPMHEEGPVSLSQLAMKASGANILTKRLANALQSVPAVTAAVGGCMCFGLNSAEWEQVCRGLHGNSMRYYEVRMHQQHRHCLGWSVCAASAAPNTIFHNTTLEKDPSSSHDLA